MDLELLLKVGKHKLKDYSCHSNKTEVGRIGDDTTNLLRFNSPAWLWDDWKLLTIPPLLRKLPESDELLYAPELEAWLWSIVWKEKQSCVQWWEENQTH